MAMFHSLTKSFRPNEGGNFWTSGALRFAATLALALLLPLVVNAYTVVMRDGRRIEIPERFVVTPSTLTYEVAEGINITLQIATIDVEATERANEEPRGSLLARINEQPARAPSRHAATAPQRASRTITNRDLEGARRARVASEAAYELRRGELGLPSLAEMRRRADAEAARASDELRERMYEDGQAEEYWRAQASELRGQLAALNAQVDYLRGLLAGMPERPAVGSYTILTGIGGPLVPRGIAQPGLIGNPAFTGRAPRLGNQGVFVAPNNGPQLTARVGFGGGATRGQVFLNTFPGRRGFGHPSVFPRGLYASPSPFFGATYADNSFYDFDRATLVQQLRELELERAGLQARWRALEDEARRAGALPGWLRP
jgi:hypothetical protein